MKRRKFRIQSDQDGSVTEWSALLAGSVALALLAGAAFSEVATKMLADLKSTVETELRDDTTPTP